MRNRNNVLVGAPDVSTSGGITIGKPVDPDSGTGIPTDATTAIDPSLGHEDGGFISEDGLNKTVGRSTEKIRDWNGDTIIITQSEHTVTLSWTFMESANATVLKSVYGENNVKVDEAAGTVTVIDNADELEHLSLNAEMKGNKNRKIRVFAPDAQITEVGDVTFTRTGAIQYQVTAECFTDHENNKLYTFIDDVDAAPAGEGGEG